MIQTLRFEALGLVIVRPLYAHFAGVSAGEPLIQLIVLSIAVMGWSALYNTAFDLIDRRCATRAPALARMAYASHTQSGLR